MKKLPLLISVPHAGLEVPVEVACINILSTEEIIRDGDEGAAEIYYPLREYVSCFVTTGIARAYVDQNRMQSDRRKDGVVKTHTCRDVGIYSRPPDEKTIEVLLEKYYRPYHAALWESASRVWLGIDCHTMAEYGPAVSPDPGEKRPRACLSNAGNSCRIEVVTEFAGCLSRALDVEVAINSPFGGGYITASKPGGIPWVQLEISREPWTDNRSKSIGVLRGFTEFSNLLMSGLHSYT